MRTPPRRASLLPAILVILASVFLTNAPRADEPNPPEGFRTLLSGENLDGWHGDNPHHTAKAPAEEREQAIAAQQDEFQAHWRVEDGELINDGHGPYATTQDEFGDIELHVQYKTVAKADSGIYLRGTPQVQIWDTTEAASGIAMPTKDRAGCSTTAPTRPANCRWCWPTNRLENGTLSASRNSAVEPVCG